MKRIGIKGVKCDCRFLINHSEDCKIIGQKKNQRSYVEKDIYGRSGGISASGV